jgi:hypothetical protein
VSQVQGARRGPKYKDLYHRVLSAYRALQGFLSKEEIKNELYPESIE